MDDKIEIMFKVVGDTHVAGFRDGEDSWYLSKIGNTEGLTDMAWSPWGRSASRIIWEELVNKGYLA